MMNPLKELQKYGQSFWLDYIRRSLITGGELERLVKEDGLRGVTSNPPIFQKAIAGSSDYDDILKEMVPMVMCVWNCRPTLLVILREVLKRLAAFGKT